ncbi:uncharacterized protein O3C94_012357 [Discoglossus pictus]
MASAKEEQIEQLLLRIRQKALKEGTQWLLQRLERARALSGRAAEEAVGGTERGAAGPQDTGDHGDGTDGQACATVEDDEEILLGPEDAGGIPNGPEGPTTQNISKGLIARDITEGPRTGAEATEISAGPEQSPARPVGESERVDGFQNDCSQIHEDQDGGSTSGDDEQSNRSGMSDESDFEFAAEAMSPASGLEQDGTRPELDSGPSVSTGLDTGLEAPEGHLDHVKGRSGSRSPSSKCSVSPSREYRRAPSQGTGRSTSQKRSASPSHRNIKRSLSPKHSVSPSQRRKRSSSRKRSVSPSQRRKRSSSRKRSASPSLRRKRSSSRKRSASPSRRRKRSLSRKRSSSPSRRRKRSSSRKRSASPSLRRKRSSSRKRSASPSRRRKRSLSRKRSASPSRRRKRSLSRKRSASPSQRRKRSLSRKRSASPSRRRKRSLSRKRSSSPSQTRKRSSSRKRSASPILRRKRSLSRKRSASPSRRRKRSLSRKRSASPILRRKRSLSRKRSASPSRRRKRSLSRKRSSSPSQLRKRSLSRKRSASPSRKRRRNSNRERSASPSRRFRRSLSRKRSTSPSQRRKRSLSRKRGASPSRRRKRSLSLKSSSSSSVKPRRSTNQKLSASPSQKCRRSLSPKDSAIPSERSRNLTQKFCSHSEHQSLSQTEVEKANYGDVELCSQTSFTDFARKKLLASRWDVKESGPQDSQSQGCFADFHRLDQKADTENPEDETVWEKLAKLAAALGSSQGKVSKPNVAFNESGNSTVALAQPWEKDAKSTKALYNSWKEESNSAVELYDPWEEEAESAVEVYKPWEDEAKSAMTEDHLEDQTSSVSLENPQEKETSAAETEVLAPPLPADAALTYAGPVPVRVWVVGDSYVYWANHRIVTQCGDKHLGFPKGMVEIRWLGIHRMRWDQVLPEVVKWSRIFSPPRILVIHAGGNDIEEISTFDHLLAIKRALNRLLDLFPKMKIVWSEIIQRFVWKMAKNPSALVRKCKKLNKSISSFTRKSGGLTVRHHGLEGDVKHLFMDDGVSINHQGIDIFIQELKEGLRNALELLSDDKPA